MNNISRRNLLLGMGALLPASLFASSGLLAQPNTRISKLIPGSDEYLPVIGMGTWQTFNVGSDPELLVQRMQVLKRFFDMGGSMIDSSPMYGSSPDVIAYGLKKLAYPKTLFSAEKVWSPAGGNTRQQFASLSGRWGVKHFDLFQIHNLHDWKEHLAVLRELKSEGKIRYIGITTSHGRRHRDLLRIMAQEQLDFVQISYNLTDRAVEKDLLPLAQERGIAVIANRPFDGGSLIKRLKRNQALPEWAQKEFDCRNWASFLLKFIVSHPAINCAIPATTRVDHMEENMSAMTGVLPDARIRNKMIRFVEAV